MKPKLTAERLERGAIIYIRQSTPGQVLHHQEGRRLQYAVTGAGSTRTRSAEAIRQKAQRGELQFSLPVGYVWTAAGRIEKEPDLRVQQALALVFAKMTELGSARQQAIENARKRKRPSRLRDEESDTLSSES